MKKTLYSPQEVKNLLLAVTPEQMAEIGLIVQERHISLNQACVEILSFIDAWFPLPTFPFSNN